MKEAIKRAKKPRHIGVGGDSSMDARGIKGFSEAGEMESVSYTDNVQ